MSAFSRADNGRIWNSRTKSDLKTRFRYFGKEQQVFLQLPTIFVCPKICIYTKQYFCDKQKFFLHIIPFHKTMDVLVSRLRIYLFVRAETYSHLFACTHAKSYTRCRQLPVSSWTTSTSLLSHSKILLQHFFSLWFLPKWLQSTRWYHSSYAILSKLWTVI